MDWSRTKTIFIITFLLLNTFLVFQLIEKRNASDINVIAQTTVREKLNSMNIMVPEDLPEERSEISHIVGQSVEIEEEAKSLVGEEQVHGLHESFVEVSLEEPFPVKDVRKDIKSFLDQYVWNADEYVYGSWDGTHRQMAFYQTYEESTIVTSEEDQLVLFFNEDNEIEGYVQRYLEFEEEGKKKDMLAPYKAIEVLLNDGIISFNDEVTSVELGYYSLFSPEGEVKVFAPMFLIKVNETSSYLVHAIDGSIQETEGLSDKGSTDSDVEEDTEEATKQAN